MKLLQLFMAVCEYFEGAREEPPAEFAALAAPWLRGLWWGVLALAITLFCGQTSKFIYIDF
jgi:hypothetical protein